MTTERSSRERLDSVLFYGTVILLGYLAFLIFAPFLGALAWAAVLVVLCHPIYVRMARRWKPAKAALAATAGVTVIVIVPALLVMIAFVRQGVVAVQSIQLGIAAGHFAWVSRVWVRIQHRFPEANPAELTALVRAHAEQAMDYLAGRVSVILRHTAVLLFDLGVTIFAMFYFFRDGDSIIARLGEVLPFEASHRDRMFHETQDLIYATVASSLVGAAVNGTLGGLAFAVTGIEAPIFWGVMIAFFSFIPVVGSALIWVPAAITLMVNGHLGRGILMIVICGVGVAVADNVLRPWLISGRTRMSTLLIFISILGGISVFGLLGIVLGPIVVAAAGGLLEFYAPRSPAGSGASKPSGRKTSAVLE
ncbi:MAG: AI-2E family transporter [Candidatus Acidiferrales bacterium]